MDNAAALVVGAHGVVGRNVLQHLAGSNATRVISASRRTETAVEGVPHLSVDLLDTEQAKQSLTEAADVTHLVYAGYQWRESVHDELDVNVQLLENTVETLLALGAPLKHVTVYHGTRAYGGTYGAFSIPAKESDPRVLPPMWYYNQEDYLEQRSATAGFAYTIFRPDIICGVAKGNPTNTVVAVAVYAMICNELGLPLRFPGKAVAMNTLVQFTDARLIGRATEWAMHAPTASNQIFNLANGDQVRWARLWPRIAAYFDMPLAEPMDFPLESLMADKAPVWDRIVAEHDLDPVPFDQLVSWQFADVIFGLDNNMVTSTIKLRQAGFHDCIDSEDMFIELLEEMRRKRLLGW